MRLYNLLHELVMKFAPMDEVQGSMMQTDASNQYGLLLKQYTEAKEKNEYAAEYNEKFKNDDGFVPEKYVTIGWKLKAVGFLESVWCRYGIAILYMIMVPVIQNLMNGGSQQQSPEDIRREMLMQQLEELNNRRR